MFYTHRRHARPRLAGLRRLALTAGNCTVRPAGPFFSEHIVPIYWVFNAASYIVPLSHSPVFRRLPGRDSCAVCRRGVARLDADRTTCHRRFVGHRGNRGAGGDVQRNCRRGLATAAYGTGDPAFALWFAIAVLAPARNTSRRRYGSSRAWRCAKTPDFTCSACWYCGPACWPGGGAGLGPDAFAGCWHSRRSGSATAPAFAANHVEFHYWRYSDAVLSRQLFHHVTGPFIEERARLWLRKLTLRRTAGNVNTIWAAIVRDPVAMAISPCCRGWCSIFSRCTTPSRLAITMAIRCGSARRGRWSLADRTRQLGCDRMALAVRAAVDDFGRRMELGHIAIYAAEPGRAVHGRSPVRHVDRAGSLSGIQRLLRRTASRSEWRHSTRRCSDC